MFVAKVFVSALVFRSAHHAHVTQRDSAALRFTIRLLVVWLLGVGKLTWLRTSSEQ